MSSVSQTPCVYLIFGAGVLGTFYAAKLQACGHDVTILARGRRAAQVRDDGLVVQQRGRGCLRARPSVIETPGPDQSYDYVLVLVRNDQVESVLPLLAANKTTPSLVFMFNNLAGPQRMIDVLGRERVMLGFPGAAGERAADGTVVATVLPALIQKTTVGELDGLRTPRVRLTDHCAPCDRGTRGDGGTGRTATGAGGAQCRHRSARLLARASTTVNGCRGTFLTASPTRSLLPGRWGVQQRGSDLSQKWHQPSSPNGRRA